MIYFEKACEHNNTRALNGLGYLYFHGNAVGLYRFVFIISLYFLKQYI
jgi:TPR repeat protein